MPALAEYAGLVEGLEKGASLLRLKASAEYMDLVEGLERGAVLPRLKASDDPIRRLVDGVCGEEWATPEERSGAQSLVARLERLKYQVDGKAEHAESVVTPPADGHAASELQSDHRRKR